MMVTGKARLTGYGLFRGDIYNGSNWTITELIIKVEAKEKTGAVRWKRDFRTSEFIPPLTSGEISFSVTDDKDIGHFSWKITEIRGYKQ
jgi:hypothetical protein